MPTGADLAQLVDTFPAAAMWKFSTLTMCILLAVYLCAAVLAQPVAQDLAQRSLIYFPTSSFIDHSTDAQFSSSDILSVMHTPEMKNSMLI